MKLLFDHNLSPHLVRRLADAFAESSHTSLVGLSQASDSELWHYAATHGYFIVTKDSDFSDLSIMRGFPPKVIWLRLGNCTTAQIEQVLRRQRAVVMAFAEDTEAGVLELY